MRVLSLALAFYVGCELDPTRLARPSSAPAPTLDAPPPPAEGPGETALYQELFAGEQGDAALAWGQRARMLAWFRYMELTGEQLDGLAALHARLAEHEARIEAARQAQAAQELAALHDGYADAITLLAATREPDEDELTALSAQLASAREQAGGGALYRVRHDELRAMLEATRDWIDSLDEDQQVALGTSRFLLRQRVGPLVAPGDTAALLGTAWDGMAFDALVLGRLPTESEPLDIGGLWATEKVRGTPDQRLSAVQRRVLTLLAARQPGLVEAIDVARGRLDPLAGLPAPAQAPASTEDADAKAPAAQDPGE